MPSRVLIAGCGYVGTELGRILVSGGCDVWGLRRSPGRLPEGIRPLAADLTRIEQLDALPHDLEAVVYAVGASASDAGAYEAAYKRGLENLLEALSRRGDNAVRIIYTSSTGVYAESEGGWVDEDSPLRDDDAPSQQIVAGERLLLASGFRATVVRFSGIYGPGRTWLIERMRSGDAQPSAGPPLWTNRIHRDDCAGVLAHVLRLAEPEALYLASDDEPTRQNDVLGWLAERMGIRLPAAPRDQEPPPRSAAGGKRCRNANLRASGYALRFPTYREGYGALLAAR